MDHQVPLKLDHSIYKSDFDRAYKLNHYNITATIAEPRELFFFDLENGRNIFNKLYKKIQRRFPYYRRFLVREQGFPFDSNILDVPKFVFLKGYWQTEKYFKKIEPIIKQEFTLKAPPTGENKKFSLQIADCNSVSLHVRRGDYVDNPNYKQIHGVCPTTYYQEAINYITFNVESPIFYIFSDDLPWAVSNINTGCPTFFMNHNREDADYEDLRLMSLCKHHIIANSTFSWWGAWLGNEPNKIVIAPQKWFLDPTRDSRDILPDTWIKL